MPIENVTDFFQLEEENEKLFAQNVRLEKEIGNEKSLWSFSKIIFRSGKLISSHSTPQTVYSRKLVNAKEIPTKSQAKSKFRLLTLE